MLSGIDSNRKTRGEGSPELEHIYRARRKRYKAQHVINQLSENAQQRVFGTHQYLDNNSEGPYTHIARLWRCIGRYMKACLCLPLLEKLVEMDNSPTFLFGIFVLWWSLFAGSYFLASAVPFLAGSMIVAIIGFSAALLPFVLVLFYFIVPLTAFILVPFLNAIVKFITGFQQSRRALVDRISQYSYMKWAQKKLASFRSKKDIIYKEKIDLHKNTYVSVSRMLLVLKELEKKDQVYHLPNELKKILRDYIIEGDFFLKKKNVNS